MNYLCSCGVRYNLVAFDGEMACKCGRILKSKEDWHISHLAPSYRKVAIIGKGMTAPYYEVDNDAYLAINDAVYIVDARPLYLIKADPGEHCTVGLQPEVIPVVPRWVDQPNSYWFDWSDLGLPGRICTLGCALPLANLWGAERITMYGFDKLLNESWGEYYITNPRNIQPLGDQKPMLRSLPKELINKCWVMDRVHHLVPLRELLGPDDVLAT